MGYVGIRGSGWAQANAIWATKSDGTDNKQLRQLKGYLWSPTWSPDGSRIAFCHYANGRGQIYVMNADASQVVNVSDNSHCDRSPVWSADSSQLAFVSDRGGNWDICKMDADGTGQVQLTKDAGTNRVPTWSPDGKSIAFESNRGGDVDIYTMSSDGASQRVLVRMPGDQKGPVWSPDGTGVAYVGLGRVYPDVSIVDARTRKRHIAVEGMTYAGSLRWSPDSSRLASVYRKNTWGKPYVSGIFVADPKAYVHVGRDDEGTNKLKVVYGAATAPYHAGRRNPTFIPSWYARGGASPRWVVKKFSGLCWSPDGKSLAFSSDIADDGYFHIHTVPAEGGPTQMLEDTASAWPQTVDWSHK